MLATYYMSQWESPWHNRSCSIMRTAHLVCQINVLRGEGEVEGEGEGEGEEEEDEEEPFQTRKI